MPAIQWQLIERLSVMPRPRLEALHEQALSVAHLSGDVAEVGVFRGGSSILLAQTLPHKRVHAFDSFDGLQNLSDKDLVRNNPSERGHAVGDFVLDAANIVRTKELLSAAGAQLYRGAFNQQRERVAELSFCLAHFDADTYESAVEFLEFFYPRMVEGGLMIFDDVGWPATPGVERAIHDFFEGVPAYKMRKNYQAVIEKR